jgi:hypothetical protein
VTKVQSAVSADTNDGSAGTVVTQNLASAITAGNAGWGHVSWQQGGASVSNVSDGTNTYPIIQTTGPDANNIMCSTFFKENLAATGAAPHLTATFAAASLFRRIHFEEWSGVATASGLNKNAAQESATFGTGTDAVTSGAQTTTAACEVVGVAYDSSSATVPSTGTGFAVGDTTSFAAGDVFRTENLAQGAPGSVAATFTTAAGTDQIHVHMLAMAPTAGGVDVVGGPVSTFLRRGPGPRLRRRIAQRFPVAPTPDPGVAAVIWRGGGPAGRFHLPQQQLNISLNAYTLAASTGVFTLTGIAAALQHNDDLVASVGAFTLTGRAANLLHGYVVSGATGTFTLTGVAAAFPRTYVLTAAKGTFAETGNVINLLVGRVVSAALGSFVETGVASAFERGYVVPASVGPFTLTGNAANLIYSGAAGSPASMIQNPFLASPPRGMNRR